MCLEDDLRSGRESAWICVQVGGGGGRIKRLCDKGRPGGKKKKGAKPVGLLEKVLSLFEGGREAEATGAAK